jgi:hypothetical protein
MPVSGIDGGTSRRVFFFLIQPRIAIRAVRTIFFGSFAANPALSLVHLTRVRVGVIFLIIIIKNHSEKHSK